MTTPLDALFATASEPLRRDKRSPGGEGRAAGSVMRRQGRMPAFAPFETLHDVMARGPRVAAAHRFAVSR